MLSLLKAFVEKTFTVHLKSAKTVKLFSRVAFIAYGISLQSVKTITIRPMKLDLQFLAQNSGKTTRAGGYYSLLFITAENC